LSDTYRLAPIAKKTCESCPLHVAKQVPTEYHDRPTSVMFIAEAPGENEDKADRPIMGKSGLMLRRLVKQINNGNQVGVAYGNVVRCRPVTDKNLDRSPTIKEVAACRNNIMLDIRELKPKVIVLCGKAAAILARDTVTKELVSTPDGTVAKLRGRWFVVKTPDGTEYPATITNHFAFVARNPIAGSLLRDDILRAFLLAAGKLPDFSRAGKPVKILNTVDEVRNLLRFMVKNLTKHDVVAMDYETSTGINRINSQITMIGFAYDEDQAYVIPYHHRESPWSREEFEQVRNLLIKFFTTKNVSFGSLIGHNIKFEGAITLDSFGVYLDSFPLECTLLRAHGLSESRAAIMGKGSGAFTLKTLMYEQLNFRGYKEARVADIVDARGSESFGDKPLQELAEYNGMDCYGDVRLYRYQDIVAEAEGYKDKLKTLGTTLHGPVSIYAAQMERNGIRINRDLLQQYMTNDSPIVKKLKQLESTLYSLESTKQANALLIAKSKKANGLKGIWGNRRAAPWLYYINKDDAKEALYIEVLKLKDTAKTTASGKYQIDVQFYKEHKGIVEVDLLAEWTALYKLKNTYIDGVHKIMQASTDMQDGRIRGQFNFHVAVTSRTSAEKPNMQNIPKGKTPMAKLIKGLYTVDPGYVMVCADYSQAEVRGWAEVSKDKNLLAAFNVLKDLRSEYLLNPTPENRDKILEAGDIHRQTAAQLNGKKPRDVTSEERDDCKKTVFGMTYGMTSFGLAKRLGCSVKEADEIIERFFKQFPEATKWLDWIEKVGFDATYVESLIFRRRHLVSKFMAGDKRNSYDESRDPVDDYLTYENRVCRNAPIQSMASDTNLMACINIQRYINQHGLDWRLINIVHDSIIAEIPFVEVAQYIKVSHDIMTSPDIFSGFGVTLKVPFESDYTVGPNWGDQIEIKITEAYQVKCRDCQKSRKVPEYPQNRRCEECGSKNVDVSILEGPIEKVLRYLDFKHHYSSMKYRNLCSKV